MNRGGPDAFADLNIYLVYPVHIVNFLSLRLGVSAVEFKYGF